MANILEVKDLRTFFFLEEGTLKALDGVSFSLERNKTLGIIGESGCGKSVTAQSILRIVPHPGRIMSGEILFHKTDSGEPVDLVTYDPFGSGIRDIRGAEISMIFQEPMTSLSPVHTIGNQIIETILLHRTPDKVEAREIAIEMLAKVGISNPKQRIDEYPYQLSGGMRQRAMIAMALSCNPAILIADEPTTALDVTVQAQILELMKSLQDQFGMGIICITHNLGVIAEIADTVAVMYLGRIVEHGTAEEVFNNPMHPYTRRLLMSIPKLGKKAGTRLATIKGTVPIPLNRPPRECGFFTRCPEAMAGKCNVKTPALVETHGHSVRCFLHSDEEEPIVEIDESRKRRKELLKETAK
ncbi:MAG: ABC transporter ATP-binding protein [Spirochaetaceae bacterium]|nr:MAG: ABC transporter ATP-binding protein [Spirochaetaceae bacterium]